MIGGLAADLVPGTLPALTRRAGRRIPRWTAALTDLAYLRERNVRYIIVHRDMKQEFPWVRFLQSTDSEPIERFLRGKVGDPVYQDRFVLAFELR